MEIICKRDLSTNVFMAELVYAINNKVKMLQMEPCSVGWKINMDLPDGEYPYKFILNNGIRMNDPEAYEYINWLNGETWSVLKVVNGEIQKSGYMATKLNNCFMHNGKTLLYPRDRACHITFDLNDVKGVHSVTALWYQPDGSLYHIEEATIDAPDDAIYKYKESFWVNLKHDTHPFSCGIWMVEIFVDGDKKIREFFNVVRSSNLKSIGIYNYAL